jgi:bacteriochlorophyllide a dehydrogenase
VKSQAVVLEAPGRIGVQSLELDAAGPADAVVRIDWSGISTGTERLLWSGRMPAFPGMGYPLVPGYESVGTVVVPDATGRLQAGQSVFVPGARCFGPVRGLFGGAASTPVVAADRALPIDDDLGERGVLLALAATARHVFAEGEQPELIVGHGVLGRMLARLALAAGTEPLVWESNPVRREGAEGYRVVDPASDPRRDYRVVCDASGDPAILDTLIGRLAPGGEVVLAGFYEARLDFAFPPAFMREARLRIAAQWQPQDLAAVRELVRSGGLSLDGLVTHREAATAADAAYRSAFGDDHCLKMILDWRGCQ